MRSIDQGEPVILVLLDLFAEFDKVVHNVFFYRLKYMIDLLGNVLECVQSSMEQRALTVYIHGIISIVHLLLSCAPYDSFLGHVVFKHVRALTCYADDPQLYISLDPDNKLTLSSSPNNLEHCIDDI